MKKLPFIILIVSTGLTSYCNAQSDIDSLKQKILRMDVAISNIHFNMRESHKEFKTGTIVMLCGMIITGFGAHLYSSQKVEKPTVMNAGLGVIGIGSLLQINSHSWFGRGAWKDKNLYE